MSRLAPTILAFTVAAFPNFISPVVTLAQATGKTIGAVNRTIADSSPYVTATLVADDVVYNRTRIPMVLWIKNKSNETITTPVTSVFVLDVRDGSNNRAPETASGCGVHFFSVCYSAKEGPIPMFSQELNPGVAARFDVAVTAEYEINKPGKYSVTAYVCDLQPHPDCFKSNTVRVTVR
jgi:hypothetical protein